MATLSSTEALLRLLLAAGIGMAIGLEREWQEKAAGFRTLTLVTMGAAAFVLATAAVLPAEIVRMAAGISTGIGFLGAGTILRDRGEVVGLTTAAAVWMAAALGIAAAFGAYALAIGGAALSLFVLLVLPLIDLERIRHDLRTYEITYAPGLWEDARVSRQLGEAGLSVNVVGMSSDPDGISGVYRAKGRPECHESAIAALVQDDDVVGFKVS